MESGGSSYKKYLALKIGRWVCLALVLTAMALGVRFGLSAISRKRSVGEKVSLPEIHSSEQVAELPDSAYNAEESILCQQANTAYRNHQWVEAVVIYTALCKKKPNNGEFAFNLAYSLHAVGRIDDAIEAHKWAARFPGYKKVALYNLACAYSLKEERARALETLRKAVEVGFISKQGPIGNDPNFEYIKDDPVFKKLEQQSLPLEQRTVYRQFDFWIGTWDIYNKKGQLIGEGTVTRNDPLAALNVSFSNYRGETGWGIAYVDLEDFRWRQLWFGPNGTFLKYVGEFKDGKMQFTGKAFGERGQCQLRRATFTPLEDGNVKYLVEVSKESGKSWSVDFDRIYRRAERGSR